MRTTVRLAAVTAAAAAVLVGSASTALAQSGSVDDKRYDVLIGPDGQRASTGTYAERVASSGIDVDRLTVNHGTNFVSIRATFHKLVNRDVGMFGDILVNGGPESDGAFEIGTNGEGGIAGGAGTGGSECTTTSQTGRITGSIKFGTNGYIQAYIPRACLGNATSLRIKGAGAFYDYGQLGKGGSQDLAAPGALARVQADPTERFYFDPVNPRYYGAASLTPSLSRN